jgi:hypothetical protein
MSTRLCEYKLVAISSSLGKNTENISVVKFFLVTECPKVLKQYLENNETELWLSFASLFHENIQMIASHNNCATESANFKHDATDILSCTL